MLVCHPGRSVADLRSRDGSSYLLFFCEPLHITDENTKKGHRNPVGSLWPFRPVFRSWLGFISLTVPPRISKPVTTLIPKRQQQVGVSHYAAIATFYPLPNLFVLGTKLQIIFHIAKCFEEKMMHHATFLPKMVSVSRKMLKFADELKKIVLW